MSVMDQIDLMDSSIPTDFGIIYTVGTCIPFLTAYFAYLIVRERSCQFKKLLHISGVSVRMYWMLNAAWDYATYIIYILVFSVSFFFLKVRGFGAYEQLLTFGFLLIYGISGIAFVYILSYLFKDEFFAFTTTTVINLVLGVYNFDLVARLLKYDLKMKLGFTFVFPQFAMSDAIHLIYENGYIRTICHEALSLYGDNASALCDEQYMCCGK